MTVEYFEVVKTRRSIRRFTKKPFPEKSVERALEAATLAPNSSNTQTWNFYWVGNFEKKAALTQACLNQSAARTASHLLVVTADPKLWSRANPRLIRWAEEANAPKVVLSYYKKLIPLTYRTDPISAFIKAAASSIIGLRRPIMRGPVGRHDLNMISVKSAALASENFCLAVTAQGGSTCMMEGFDAKRVQKILKLRSSTQIVMVIAVGYEADRATWGPQYRLPIEEVVHRV